MNPYESPQPDDDQGSQEIDIAKVVALIGFVVFPIGLFVIGWVMWDTNTKPSLNLYSVGATSILQALAILGFIGFIVCCILWRME